MTHPPSNANFREIVPGPLAESTDQPRGFWRTTGCATVIAAVIGAGATLVAQQIASSSATPSAPPTVTVTVTEPGAGAGQPGPPPGAGDSDVIWKNHFNMDNYVSFDTIPPQNETGSLSQDVGGTYSVSDDGALWESPITPTKQQCLERIATHGQAEIRTDVGTRFCYRTPEGRVVFIDVIGVEPGDGLLNSPRFETEVTVWRK